MPIKLDIQQGKSTKQVEVYTKQEVEEILNRVSRLLSRASGGENGRDSGSGGDVYITRGILGNANIDANSLYKVVNGKKTELNWTDQFLIFYADEGTLPQTTVSADETLPNVATLVNSYSDNTVPVDRQPIGIVDNDKITGSITVENNEAGGTGPHEIDIIYEGYNGSSWIEIDRTTLSALGGDTATDLFIFNGLTGYEQFRTEISAISGNWTVTSYEVEQQLSETILNNRGLGIYGGQMFIVDFLTDVTNALTNQVYLEADGSGNFNMKVKG